MHPMCFLQKTHRDIAVGFQMAAHEVVRTPCLGEVTMNQIKSSLP